jgi:hypothetical protein
MYVPSMTESFRLVFRGEVLAGQHKAVVKQRLGAVLKLDGPRLEALFTGKPVTVRKFADGETAARFEIAFKRAGARLRIVPIDAAPEAKAAPASAAAGFDLAAPGARLQEPVDAAPAAVDTSHLTIAEVGADMAPRKAPAEPVIDLDEIDFEIAPPGARMADAVDSEPPPAPDTSHLRLQ